MTLPIAGRAVPVAAIVAAAGGAAAIVSAPLAWASATVGGSTQSVGGLDKDYMNGRTEIVLGIALLALTVVWILDLDIPFLAAGVAVVGVAILAVPLATYFTTVYYSLSLKDTTDAMARIGGSAGPGIGLLLAAGGGVVAIVAGAAGFIAEA